MALLSVIRRWAFRDQLSIREISRRTGLSRNTIRKYLRSGAVEPRLKVPDRPSKLDAFADKLSGRLKVEAAKSRKRKRTTKQLHADLISLGFDDSYSRVAAFVRDWKADRQREQQTSGRGTFVPLAFQSGRLWVKSFCCHMTRSPLICFQYPWSEPTRMTRPVSKADSNSHPVAVRDGCTTIPLALRQWLRRTKPFWSSAFKAKSNFGSSTWIYPD